MAGYRAGFLAGDIDIVSELLKVAKNIGLMVPTPVQAAMMAALSDQDHVTQQRARYLGRRELLRPLLERAGFRIDDSQGGLYLWVTRGEDCRATAHWLAVRGILCAPGDFYGEDGVQHVRLAMTATDERITAAASRLAESASARTR
jgi:aspartate/methionine/tyrosine aminotransferase